MSGPPGSFEPKPDEEAIRRAAMLYKECQDGRTRGPMLALWLGLGLVALTGLGALTGLRALPWAAPFGPLLAGLAGLAAAIWVERRHPRLLPRASMLGWLGAATLLIGVVPLATAMEPAGGLAAAAGLFGALTALHSVAVLNGPLHRATDLELFRRLAAMPPDERTKMMEALREYRDRRRPGNGGRDDP